LLPEVHNEPESLLPAPPQSIAGSSDFESRRRRSLDPDKIIFKPDCIFCEKEGKKKVKVKGSWTTEGTVRFEYDGGVTPKNCTGKT
jgi:hypothetical protein